MFRVFSSLSRPGPLKPLCSEEDLGKIWSASGQHEMQCILRKMKNEYIYVQLCEHVEFYLRIFIFVI